MASTRLGFFVWIAGFIVLSACTRSKLPDVYLLTGECKIEVSTPHDDAEILVDGILVGRGRVTTSLPCGQKQVRVKLEHHKPFEGIFVAEPAKTLLVPIKLEPLTNPGVYALSQQLLQDIRAGKVAKGAVEGGTSAAAAADDEGGAAVEAEINWDDWT